MVEGDSDHLSVRIESADDPALNRELFSLYKKVIKPLQTLENLVGQQSNLQNEVNENTGFQPFLLPLNGFIAFYLVGWLISTAVILYKEQTSQAWLDFEGKNMALTIIIWLAAPLLVYFLLMLIFSIIETTTCNAKVPGLKKALADVNHKIDVCTQHLAPAMAYVPPEYRFSAAIDYFVKSYENSRVDNLKEAVNLYDTYQYRNDVTNKLDQIHSDLQMIAFNQRLMMGQLSAIAADIWFSNMIF